MDRSEKETKMLPRTYVLTFGDLIDQLLSGPDKKIKMIQKKKPALKKATGLVKPRENEPVVAPDPSKLGMLCKAYEIANKQYFYSEVSRHQQNIYIVCKKALAEAGFESAPGKWMILLADVLKRNPFDYEARIREVRW